MHGEKSERWRELCEQTAVEQDPCETDAARERDQSQAERR